MRPKKRYRNNKHIWNIGNYFTRYFLKRTCKKIKRLDPIKENIEENEGSYREYESNFHY